MKKLERLLTLTATLLRASQPLSADELQRRVPGYPEPQASFRRAFERDKDDLREMGVPITVATVPDSDPPVDGYLIRDNDYYLEDPGLLPEELAAIGLAAQMVQFGAAAADEAIWKLGGSGPSSAGPAGQAVAAVPSDPLVIALFDAVRERRTIAFSYNETDRCVEPWRLSHQRGRWYVVGFDQTRQAERNFRVDRIDGPLETSDPDAFVRPADAGEVKDRAPWEFDETDEIVASVLVDADQAGWARSLVGSEAVIEERSDGGVVVQVGVSNTAAFRSFVLGFRHHAEVLSPPELRADMVEWLRAISA